MASIKKTTFPYSPPINPLTPSILGTSPNRFWYNTGSGWASREWNKGERQAYVRTVLNRQPTYVEA